MPTIDNVLDDKLHWYKDAIIYELHIKAFRDGNGDGIGDFEGLLGKLDYLQDLGVTAIWVLPFYPSPLRDDGYDIADYYNINPSYGKVKDFQHFLMEAHSRNLKVITELVINHTSDQHPWFQRARRAPKGSPERDFYVWTDDPNQFKDVRIIFQDFETSNWTWDAEAGQYYWHRFFHHQPDLNFDNLLVQEEVFKILDYWCTMGVDGFRLDAVPYLFEREGTNGENLPETHDYLKKLRRHVDENFPGTLLLAEANMWPEDSASYFGDGDECQMNYHFPVMPRMFMALQMEDRYPITDIFEQTPEIPETCQWAIFLRNHDELTLEMVTDEERDYMYKVYAKDPKAKINLGIRHRLAPLMENSRRKIELLNCLLFSLRGTPVIYYGDEIGMGDNFYLGDRDGVRTPMQWSPDRNGGFSQANPQKLYLPVILDPEYHYESVNVETQGRNPSSLLWFMKQMIHMRKKYKAFSRGEMKFISVENPKVLAFIRSYHDQHILVVVNLSRYSQAAELDLGEFKGYLPVEVFSRNKFPAIKEDSPYFFTLGAHAYYWFILRKVNPDADEIPVPIFTLGKWKDLTKTLVVSELENNILPAYLLKSKWFEGRNRIMHGVRITDLVGLPDTEPEVYMMLIEVSYESGFPEMYQLPLTYIHQSNSEKIVSEFPQSVISKMHMEDGDALLCDAFYFHSFHRSLLKKISDSETVSLKTADIRFYGTRNFIEEIGGSTEIKTRLISEDEINASVAFDTSWYLKMYRKVDRAINPDLEISRFLSEQTSFKSIPRFSGAIEWEFQNGSIVLGMMQELIEYHGDGWSYMKERIVNYNERLLSLDKESLPKFKLEGSLANPLAFEDVPAQLQELFGGPIAESTRLLGERTADMHLALASVKNNVNFQPEDFSLHYQRSLFAGLQSLVRTTYHGKVEYLKNVPDAIRPEIDEVLSMKEELLNHLKRIHSKKFDVIKIRHHGNFHLGQILFTGKDVMIRDFGGDPNRSYSERRLKRSPLRDLAFMIRSFHYAAYHGLMLDQLREEDLLVVKPYAAVWTHYVSGFFMHHYYEKVKKSPFIPEDKNDLLIMLETYLLEKAIYDLDYELKHRPEWAIVPASIILSIVKK